MNPLDIVSGLVEIALKLVSAEVLHGKVDELAQIKAERDAADLAAKQKFGEAP
jgi:hypothetical protein